MVSPTGSMMTTIALETGKAETQSADIMQWARPNLHQIRSSPTP